MKATILTVLLLTATAACGSDTESVFEPVSPPPPAPPVLTTLQVTPAAIALFPGMTGQLSVAAWDQRGQPLTGTADAYTYVTSDPEIVTVSSRGTLTAVAAGTAEIKVSLKSGGVEQTRRVTATVRELVPGRYSLTAPISQSGWGLAGGVFQARLTLRPGSSMDGPATGVSIGTFADLVLIGPDGTTWESAREGTVTSRVDVQGTLTIHLVVDQFARWEGKVESSGENSILGWYLIGDGLAGGNFTVRRE